MPPRPYRGLLPVLLLVLSLGSLAAAVDLRAQPVPIGSEMRLSPTDDIYRESPRAVVDSTGRLVVIWREWESDPAGNRPVRLAGRRFDPEGRPLGEVFQVTSLPFFYVDPPALAAGPDGGFAVAWMGNLDGFRVFFRLFDASGGATAVERSVHEPGLLFQVAPNVAMGTEGGILLSWVEQDRNGRTSRLFVRSFDAGGQPREPAFAVYPVPHRVYVAPALAALPGGRFAIAWRAETDEGQSSLLARILDARGLPEGRVVEVRPREPVYGYLGAPALSADARGRFVVVWHDFDGHGNGIFARRFDPDARPLGEAFRLNETTFGDQEYPHVASADDGAFLASWKSEGQGGHLFGRYVDAAGRTSSEIPLDPPERLASYVYLPRLACDPRGNFVAVWGALVGEPPTGSGIFGRRFSASCRFGSEPVALHDGRFQVEACWHGFDGFRAPAAGSPVSDHAGVLRFFPGDEPEMVVKIEERDGTYRVFLGGLTHLEVLVRITDTVTGASKGYLNPLGTLTSRLDPSAFTDAGAGDGPAIPGTAAIGTLPAPPCRCDPSLRLDLLDGRIRVEALWTDPEGGVAGFGQGVELSRESGTLWFSRAEDPDVAVKVLDGREINGRLWVFLAALTERKVMITITDTDTGRQRTYTKSAGSLRSWVDLSTFED